MDNALVQMRWHPRHELGFVPQAIALYEELSAEENLRLFGKLYGLAGRELRARVDHGLHAAQLFERRQDKVQTYSGGMKRRINVVASILHRPALLLCDEADRRRRSAIAKRHLRVPPAAECRRDDNRLFDALHGGKRPGFAHALPSSITATCSHWERSMSC